MLEPIIIRSIGRLVAITPLQYNLEFSRNLPRDSGAYTSSIHGIMRSCVTNAFDLGPFPPQDPE